MSKQRRTADDFVRDIKAKQQHSTSGEQRRGSVEQQDACATTTASNSLTFISKVSRVGAQRPSCSPKTKRGGLSGF
jgi:hypothetical protein